MNILIVGNILKDVYLRLDTRTEDFELDKHNVSWLDLSFDASEHHFFNRFSSFGGVVVSLEVLTKLGMTATVCGSDFAFGDDGPVATAPAEVYRYILTQDDNVSYLVPSAFRPTNFVPPAGLVDYIYVDRSAYINEQTATEIADYLKANPSAKLIYYARELETPTAKMLAPMATLVFYENNRVNAELLDAPVKNGNEGEEGLFRILEDLHISLEKLVMISERDLTYGDITMPISIERIDQLTHLSAYSIASATILGSFLLGETVENSLKMAKANVENATLNATLGLEELKNLASNMQPSDNLELIAANLVVKPKGILAADESGGSIAKKFAQLNIPDTFENRHAYRNIFFTTPDLEKYINGVILFDETARDYADNGQSYVDYLTAKRIIPGVKVDQGLAPLVDIVPGHPYLEETYTKGLDGLSDRLKEYYQMGLRFAKWRVAFGVTLSDGGDVITPTRQAVVENCRILAEYAKKCQFAGLVPIVEPEVMYDGNYSIEKCAEITGGVLDELFRQLAQAGVNLRACLLKCNMVLAGKQYDVQSTPEEVGRTTAEVLKNHVPAELAGVVFLSGGQTPEQATANLLAVQQNGPFPWPVTFSFARALQDPALFAWEGNNENIEKARQAFGRRLAENQGVGITD
ncbi:fructose-bisphosphate aldolase class I [Candidatus Saccharibacteria bacterium]|nr:fructose-bisphosphate aldolase class I [Candidatus Saccharibacteria bacterium]